MGHVVPIGKHLKSELLQACEEMRQRVSTGEIVSMIALVQVQGSAAPQCVALGKFKVDPYLALAALERARVHLNRTLDANTAADDFTASHA